MKTGKILILALLALIFTAGPASAASRDFDRERSDVSKMFHKLGRGVVNIVTCWVEVPRNIASEWEKTDPATGLVLGTVKGIGWGFTRLATGAYETISFPFPVPRDYAVMMEPEFVVTDVWGDGIPELTDMYANDPKASGEAPIYPNQFRF